MFNKLRAISCGLITRGSKVQNAEVSPSTDDATCATAGLQKIIYN